MTANNEDIDMAKIEVDQDGFICLKGSLWCCDCIFDVSQCGDEWVVDFGWDSLEPRELYLTSEDLRAMADKLDERI
tara:strand:+ start:421 stop:648 length:228 start_codon:yes stop_codon:yes gene_type:complete